MTCFRTKDGRTAKEICRKEGISYSTFYRRVDEHGDSVDDALAYTRLMKTMGKAKKMNGLKFIVDGIPLTDWCKLHKANYKQMRIGIAKGEYTKNVLIIKTKADLFLWKKSC